MPWPDGQDPDFTRILGYMQGRVELARREWQIVKLLPSGARNLEIADRIGTSEGTVKSLMKRIAQKLFGKSGGRRTEILAWYQDRQTKEHAIAMYLAWHDVMPRASWPR